jgi:sugar (pentulose or hexulose) kinase
MHDQYAAALGAGVMKPGDVMFGAGTAWVLVALSKELTPPVTSDALVCHHIVEGCFGQILSLRTGGSAIGWAKELFGFQGLSGGEFDAVIDRVPPGAGGVVFWPFVAPNGASELGTDIRGRFAGLQLCHPRENLMRAVIEGLAFELNRHLNFLRVADWNPRRIVMCGGAAQSGVTPQIIADVIGLPVQVSAAGEEGLLGALIVARGLLEPKTSLKTLAAQVTRSFRTFRPGAHAAAYEPAFADYLKSLPTPQTS